MYTAAVQKRVTFGFVAKTATIKHGAKIIVKTLLKQDFVNIMTVWRREKMKKTERHNIKIEAIRMLKSRIDFNKRLLKRDWRNRYSSKLFKTTYRVAIKTDFETIHRNLFILRAVEKQIPMPVKIVRRPIGLVRADGSEMAEYLIARDFACQRCGEAISHWLRGTAEYCPYCGQKLWWPKN